MAGGVLHGRSKVEGGPLEQRTGEATHITPPRVKRLHKHLTSRTRLMWPNWSRWRRG
jgi:hypothetical protein